MAKQDRQGVRTAAEVERKYNLAQTFGGVSEMVAQAKAAGAAAEAAVANLDKRLDQAGVLSRLTDSGAAKGIYLIDGQLYFHASYIGQGIIKSKDGAKIILNLDTGAVVLSDVDAALDRVEAQSVYTAIMTDTLAAWQTDGIKARIEAWYDAALWTADMVNNAVIKGILTSDEAAGITG
jgi:hypothetical protein